MVALWPSSKPETGHSALYRQAASAAYAKQVGAPFIFLTNGELIYFWDYQNDDARIVNSFFSRRDLERLGTMRAERKPLATVPIPDTYLRQGETLCAPTRRRRCRRLTARLNWAEASLPDRVAHWLRQDRSDRALPQESARRLGRPSASCSWSTAISAEKQAIEAIQDLLPGYSSYWLKPEWSGRKSRSPCPAANHDWPLSRVLSGYFDVVVMDECHRSIYGAGRLRFRTSMHCTSASPPPGHLHQAQHVPVLSLQDDTPDYSYPIREAFKEGFLVPTNSPPASPTCVRRRQGR